MRLFAWRPNVTVLVAYSIITIALTWPLSTAISRNVPGDFGDPLLNMWILGWGAESTWRIASGDMTVRDAWNANIFHPDPLALGFSEHLFAQVLQIMPLYYLTDNLILCYNLLFLSSFVFSGFFMYMLVTDLTSDRRAGFLAGLVFAFIPYRMHHLPHLQVLSAQWMPLAMFAFRRFVLTLNVSTLWAAAMALLMQNWSSGYYLLFFPPFLAGFVAHEAARAGRIFSARVWAGICAAAILVSAGTAPFVFLYLNVRQLYGFERPYDELLRFSADVYGYLTAPEILRLWGDVLVFAPKSEGAVFLGLVPVLAAAFAVCIAARDSWHHRLVATASNGLRRHLAAVVAVFLVVTVALFVSLVFGASLRVRIFGAWITATNAQRLLIHSAVAATALLVLAPRLRLVVRNFVTKPEAFAVAGLLLACWLSLGPEPATSGRRLEGLGLYNVLYEYVPGFSGLRAPARFAMIAAVFISILTGFAAAWCRRRPFGLAAVAVAGMLFVVETTAVPIPVNVRPSETFAPADRVYPASSAPPVYRLIGTLPREAVIAELPFGSPVWEVRYVYYSTVHWRRLVNGFSGGFPPGYSARGERLERLPLHQTEAWQALAEAHTTHVVLHEQGFPQPDAHAIHEWLTSRGARQLARFETDVLYELPWFTPAAAPGR